MERVILALILFALSQTSLAGTVYYVDIVNTAKSDIVYFGVARRGSNRFHNLLAAHRILAGYGAPATIAIRKGEDESCMRDVRIAFADGRVTTHHDFNICKN